MLNWNNLSCFPLTQIQWKTKEEWGNVFIVWEKYGKKILTSYTAPVS